MSKKSFKDNPALQFMSRSEVKEIKDTDKKTDIVLISDEDSGSGNFAENFVYTPVIFEAKSKRFNMLIRPSVFAHLKKKAEFKGTSVNDLIHTIIEIYIENDNKK